MTGTGLTPVSFRKGRAHLPRLSAPRDPNASPHARFWREEEEAVLLERFAKHGAAACRELLPHRSLSTIYQHARKLGLKAGGRAPWQRREYGPAMDARILEAWPLLAGRGAVAALADRLDVPRSWLSVRATKLGLTAPHRKEPEWTAAEEELLGRIPLHNLDRASEVFRQHGYHRTPSSLTNKAKRLKVPRRYAEALSGSACARILGIDTKTFTVWCLAGDIEATRRGTQRRPQQGGDVWDVQPAVLRQFILDKLERIDIRKVEKFAFAALLAGGETASSAQPCDEVARLTARNRDLEAEVRRLAQPVIAAELVRLVDGGDRRARRTSWRERQRGRRRWA